MFKVAVCDNRIAAEGKQRHGHRTARNEFEAGSMDVRTGRLHIEAILIGAIVLLAWARAVTLLLGDSL